MAQKRGGIQNTLKVDTKQAKLNISSLSKEFKKFGTNATKSLDKIKKSSDSTAKSVVDINKKVSGLTSAFSKLAKVGAGIVAVTGAVRALGAAFEALDIASKIIQEQEAFHNMTISHSADTEALLANLDALAKGTIDNATLINRAGLSMMMGLAPEKLPELMKIARVTARLTGQDVANAFTDLSRAIGRKSRLILDNLGIIVDASAANMKYAESIGKTVRQLNDAEKAQAFMNAALAGGNDLVERIGDIGFTSGEKFQQFTSALTDIKNEGLKALFKTLEPMLPMLTGMAEAALKIVGAYTTLAEAIRKYTADSKQLYNLEMFRAKSTGERYKATLDHLKALHKERRKLEAVRPRKEDRFDVANQKAWNEWRAKIKEISEMAKVRDRLYAEIGGLMTQAAGGGPTPVAVGTGIDLEKKEAWEKWNEFVRVSSLNAREKEEDDVRNQYTKYLAMAKHSEYQKQKIATAMREKIGAVNKKWDDKEAKEAQAILDKKLAAQQAFEDAIKGIRGSTIQDQFDAIDDEVEREQGKLDKLLAAIKLKGDEEIEEARRVQDAKALIKQEGEDRKRGITNAALEDERTAANKSMEWDKMSQEKQFTVAADITQRGLGVLSNLMGADSKRAFERQKAFKVAMATASGAQAIADAYAAGMSTVNPMSPAIAASYMALAGATAGMNIAAVASTKYTPHAKGGLFTNSVVDSPTSFNMGLMGEAGPEAIMPLSRDSSGKLGVTTSTGTQSPKELNIWLVDEREKAGTNKEDVIAIIGQDISETGEIYHAIQTTIG